MQPVNTIALVLILGLEFMFVGHEADNKILRFIGGVITTIGWIWNIVVILTK